MKVKNRSYRENKKEINLHDHRRIFHNTSTWAELLYGTRCVKRSRPSAKKKKLNKYHKKKLK